MALLVANVPWDGPEADPLVQLTEHLGLEPEQVLDHRLLKRSVDGRRRPPQWLANYRVELADEQALLDRGLHGVRRWTERDERRFAPESKEVGPRRVGDIGIRPIVVGAGPAGLFAALRFAEAGVPVRLLERGDAVEERHYAVRRFWRHRELDPESNVVYGEGGAGAFSDGKIYTRRRDGDLGYIFRRLVDFGAHPAILEEGWAHLGTDKIREILPRIRARLEELGAELRFRCCVEDLVVDSGRVRGVVLAGGEVIEGAPVVVAAGHSARDVFAWMLEAGAEAVLRPMHIGARVEHPQKLIDQARYGRERRELPPASYRLTSRPPKDRARPAHTFCMCPGGTVVPATNHLERVVVNGMSYSGRRAWFANSAVIAEVRLEDLAHAGPLAGMDLQDEVEQRAFVAGGGDYSAPAQLVGDFLAERPSTGVPRVSYPQGVRPASLQDVLPEAVWRGLAEALRHFDRKLPGFAGPEAVLIAPETRTTAPLRFVRTEGYESTTLPGLSPVGEGAGHAGGIVSAALDGMRAADALIASSVGGG